MVKVQATIQTEVGEEELPTLLPLYKETEKHIIIKII